MDPSVDDATTGGCRIKGDDDGSVEADHAVQIGRNEPMILGKRSEEPFPHTVQRYIMIAGNRNQGNIRQTI